MPIENSCFISYRHTKEYKGKSYTERIVEDLKAELELRVAEKVYRDTDRLRGAEFYQESLATEICKSVCMVVLFWPTYFSVDYPFCAREFKAMEELEQKRLKLLDNLEERQKGLIVILAIRDYKLIPEKLRNKRLCKDFEAYTLKPEMREDPGFQSDMLEISRYIADRCRAFQKVAAGPGDPFGQCANFVLPDEKKIKPWIQRFAQGGVPFANRRKPL